jgi:serine/threonine protein kinase
MRSERWQKIEDLFNSALDLEPGRREQFLKQACSGDESVYEEVQQLLKLEAEAENLIDSPAMEILARNIAGDSKPPGASGSVIGKTIGRYRVVKELGKGGMGEVYQAKDRKLERDVAIKILPEEFAGDSDRLDRFRREAKVLASLSHPNIATLYELEESEELHFIVLEMVEGETLADRMKAGPIPIEESLKLSLQMAEALEMAHEKGIIHRDLKPANVKITPEGTLKVLDFGLAKTFAEELEDRPYPPESSDAITQKGLILGTAAYMSPEQAKGKDLDKRTDVWSFGVVLFEMLTGQKLFTGDSPAEILSTVLTAAW